MQRFTFCLRQPKFTDWIIPLPLPTYHKNMGHSNRHVPYLLSYRHFLFYSYAFSNHSVFLTNFSALCRVLSSASVAPLLSPDITALSSYFPRSACGLYCCRSQCASSIYALILCRNPLESILLAYTSSFISEYQCCTEIDSHHFKYIQEYIFLIVRFDRALTYAI